MKKQQDIAQKNQQELLDWQRRSVGGLVKQVDAQTGDITLSISNKTVVVSTTPKTTVKRYAPDSVKWEDATAAKLDEIHPGDQLRAKGNKNEDGTQFAAEEIVAGTFRNIAGLVTVVDPAHGTLTVHDLATKSPVTVAITPDSQLKKLPPELAQGLAMRLKGGAQRAAPGAAPAASAPAATSACPCGTGRGIGQRHPLPRWRPEPDAFSTARRHPRRFTERRCGHDRQHPGSASGPLSSSPCSAASSHSYRFSSRHRSAVLPYPVVACRRTGRRSIANRFRRRLRFQEYMKLGYL